MKKVILLVALVLLFAFGRIALSAETKDRVIAPFDYGQVSGGGVSDSCNITNIPGVADKRHILLVDDDFLVTDSTHYVSLHSAVTQANALSGYVLIRIMPGTYDTIGGAGITISRGYVDIEGVSEPDSVLLLWNEGGGTDVASCILYSGSGYNTIKNVTIKNVQTSGSQCKDGIAWLPSGELHLTIDNCIINAYNSTSSVSCYPDNQCDTMFPRSITVTNTRFMPKNPASPASYFFQAPFVRYDSICRVFIDNCQFLGATGNQVDIAGRFKGEFLMTNCYFDSCNLQYGDARSSDTFCKSFITGIAKRSYVQGENRKGCYMISGATPFYGLSSRSKRLDSQYLGIESNINMHGLLYLRGSNDTTRVLEGYNKRTDAYNGELWYINNASTGIGLKILNAAGGAGIRVASNTGKAYWGDGKHVFYAGVFGTDVGFKADANCDTSADFATLMIARGESEWGDAPTDTVTVLGAMKLTSAVIDSAKENGAQDTLFIFVGGGRKYCLPLAP